MVETLVRNAGDLVASIERGIVVGDLVPGDRLAPVRTAANDLGLSATTVAAAYRTLGARGFVVGEGRRGTFVASRPALRVPIAAPMSAGIIDLSTGNPDPALLPDLGVTLRTISSEHAMYGDAPIDPELERLMRIDFESDHIDAAHVAVVSGALDGIERVLAAHLHLGDRVGVEDPGYSSVFELVAAMGFRPVPVSVDRYGPDPIKLGEVLSAGLDALIVTPRAQNPTGAALDRRRAGEIAAVVDVRPNLLVIEDDHAGAVSGQPFRSVISSRRERWAVVRSTAKSLGPDLRVGLLAGDPTTVDRVTGRQALGAGWVSNLLQRCVAHLLGSDQTTTKLASVASTYAEHRSAVVEILADSGIEADARSGLNVWVGVTDEAAAVAAMQSRGWAIRSGASYRIDAAPGVRLSVAAASVEQLEAAATDLADVLRPTRRTRSV